MPLQLPANVGTGTGTSVSWATGASTKRAFVERNAVLSCSNTTSTNPVWDTSSLSSDTARYSLATVPWFFGGANPQFIISKPGLYLIWGEVDFATSSTVGTRSISLSGSKVASSAQHFFSGLDRSVPAATHNDDGGVAVGQTLVVVPTDECPFFFYVSGWQNSGGALNIVYATITITSVLDF